VYSRARARSSYIRIIRSSYRSILIIRIIRAADTYRAAKNRANKKGSLATSEPAEPRWTLAFGGEMATRYEDVLSEHFKATPHVAEKIGKGGASAAAEALVVPATPAAMANLPNAGEPLTSAEEILANHFNSVPHVAQKLVKGNPPVPATQIASTPATVAADAEIEDAAFEQELSQLVGSLMAKHAIPGVAVGVSRRGKPPLLQGHGVTNLRAPLPVDGTTTLFQIGSNTKTYTALCCAILAEQGKLDLDAPVQHYCPDFGLPDSGDLDGSGGDGQRPGGGAAAAAAVTVRMLLNHTGGWDGDALLVRPVGGRNDSALAELPAAMAAGLAEQLTAPGTVHHYNNTGFSLAGRVIEVAAGQPYEQVVEALVFRPLGLAESFFFPEDCVTRPTAAGHSSSSSSSPAAADEPGGAAAAPAASSQPRVLGGWLLPRSSFPAGALCCSAADLLEYGRFWLGDGVPLLSSAGFAEMLAPATAVAAGEEERCGLSWFVTPADPARGVGRRLRHGGGTNGQISGFSIFPDNGLVVVTLTNSDDGGVITEAVEQFVLEKLRGGQPADPPARPVLAEFEPGCAPADYAGRYYNNESLTEFEVQPTANNTKLRVVTRPHTPISGWGDEDELAEALPETQVVGLVGPDAAEEGYSFVRAGTGAWPGPVAWLRAGRLYRWHPTTDQARL
jgi:CubicO group peptidase (beta-lactamase class C family)